MKDDHKKTEWKKFLGFYPQIQQPSTIQQEKLAVENNLVDKAIDKFRLDIKKAITCLKEQSKQRHNILTILSKEDISEEELIVAKALLEEYIKSIEAQDVPLKPEYATIRFRLNGRWTAKEIVQTLAHIEDLYNFGLAHKKINNGRIDSILKKNDLVYDFDRIIETGEQLQILRVTSKAPGFIDVAGIASSVGYVKDFVLKIIELISLPEWIDTEKQKLRTENARKFILSDRDARVREPEIWATLNWMDFRQGTFIDLVEQGKITSVEKLTANIIRLSDH